MLQEEWWRVSLTNTERQILNLIKLNEDKVIIVFCLKICSKISQ